MNQLTFRPVGIIHSPFQEPTNTPIQATMAQGVEAIIEILPEFALGLMDLERFDRIWVLYWIHRAAPARLVLKPFMDDQEHGVFATRSPCRPNPIGLSCVQLVAIEKNRLRISGVDMVDQTPVLDIKPYVQAFDSFAPERVGWLANKGKHLILADERFDPTSADTGR